MQYISYSIAIIAASMSLCLWLEKRRPLFARLSSGFLAIFAGYILSELNIFTPKEDFYVIANNYLLPLSIISAVMWSQININNIYPLIRNSFAVLTLTIVITLVFTFLLLGPETAEREYTGGFPSITSAIIFSIVPQSHIYLNPFTPSTQWVLASAIITYSVIFTFVLFTLFRFFYRTYDMKTVCVGSDNTLNEMESNYSTKLLSDISCPSGFLIALAISNAILLVVMIMVNLVPPIPLPLLLVMVLLLIKYILPCGKLYNEFLKIALIGSHIWLFLAGTLLSLAPWTNLQRETLVFILIITITKMVIIFVTGKYYNLDIEVLCIIFITLTCGPLIGALVVTAKRWDSLLIPAFVLGFMGEIISWSMCMFVIT